MPIKIFFCYAHEDEPLLNKLKTQLSPLQWQGLIDPWHDRNISAGTEWEEEIKEHLDAAQIILLMVSPDFMASKYCYSVEMKRAIERHERGEARVIPIIVRPVYWQGVLGKLQALPTDAKPVTLWYNVDEALFDVTEGIRKVAELDRKAKEDRINRDKIDRVIIALENPKYDWRTIEGVIEETQLPPEEVHKIIRELGSQVVKSKVPDNNGRALYTTKTHFNRRK
jgi:hypothetical protein